MWSDILDGVVNQTGEPPPFVRALRIPGIDGWERGRVWGTWQVDPEMHHAAGAVFGGYIAAIADSYVGLAMLSTMADDEWFTTSDLRVSYFRPIVKGIVEIVAEVIHRGQRQGHVESVFVDDRDKVIAKAVATQVVIPMSEYGAQQ
ncbi:MAG: PaaI family thioesterase, partial [Actinomycetota bacterium]